MEITYETDLFHDYKAEFDLCHDLQSLRSLIDRYKAVSPDLADVKMGNLTDFEDFRKGLDSDRQGVYPGDEWCKKYGPLVIPINILIAQMTAIEFGVPWGVAYLQICVAIGNEEAKQGFFEPVFVM